MNRLFRGAQRIEPPEPESLLGYLPRALAGDAGATRALLNAVAPDVARVARAVLGAGAGGARRRYPGGPARPLARATALSRRLRSAPVRQPDRGSDRPARAPAQGQALRAPRGVRPSRRPRAGLRAPRRAMAERAAPVAVAPAARRAARAASGDLGATRRARLLARRDRCGDGCSREHRAQPRSAGAKRCARASKRIRRCASCWRWSHEPPRPAR